MKLPERLIELFDYPVDAVLAALPPPAAPVWDANPYRQVKHQVHSQTRSIIFEWISDSWQPGQKAVILHSDPAPGPLTDAVYACADKLNERYHGRIIRLLLAELKPRAKISPHKDMGPGVVLVHRLHVPVVSNPDVKFFIDDVSHYLKPGIAYEFDNTRRHAVDNDSDSPRIHLMCDILPAELVL
jgi:Aspartyl/Asparaginyl beta-hydroxylase